jgi:hypothetical protein
MNKQEVHPGIGNEPEANLKEEYLSSFHELKKLLAAAAARGDSLQVSITKASCIMGRSSTGTAEER